MYKSEAAGKFAICLSFCFLFINLFCVIFFFFVCVLLAMKKKKLNQKKLKAKLPLINL